MTTLPAPLLAAAEKFRGKRIAVTGLTGFVGRHLLRALLAGGAEVTCIARRSSTVSSLPPEVRVAHADLSTGQGLSSALHGQDYCIHLAALLFGLSWQDYIRSNAVAAQHLGSALAAEMNRPGSSLSRVILVSSLAATGPASASPGVSDATPPMPVSAYGWSKFMTEQTLGRHLDPLGPSALVTLRPPIIYGSGDKGMLPYFKSAKAGLIVTPGFKRPFPVSAIHALDMAQAILCALKPEARGVYHCNDGAEYTMAELGLAMADALHCKARVLTMPLPVMQLSAALCGLAAPLGFKLTKRAPNWNPDKYLEAKEAGWLCDGARIRRELGYTPAVPLADGLAEAVAGYRERAWL